MHDDWKITAKLTMNLGLRWETHAPRFDANDRQNGFDLIKINPVSNTPGVVTCAGRDGVGRNVYDGDYNNFGPRFGLAWKPTADGRTVIRAELSRQRRAQAERAQHEPPSGAARTDRSGKRPGAPALSPVRQRHHDRAPVGQFERSRAERQGGSRGGSPGHSRSLSEIP